MKLFTMVERLYLKENLSFQMVDLNFQTGLILFTGASGAGKSVLMNALLSTIGIKDSKAKLSELVFSNSINLDKYGVENDEVTIFKQIKKEKLRFFINNQTVSKKVVKEIGLFYVKYLTHRDIEEFQQSNLLSLLDSLSQNRDFHLNLTKFKELYSLYINYGKKIKLLDSEITEIESREEFIKFEIDKIESINPKIGEDKELYRIKKRVSKRDKIENYLLEINKIFDKEYSIYELFELMSFDSQLIKAKECLINLKTNIEDVRDYISELNLIDIEHLLNRIELLSELKERYGSIEDSIKYMEMRKQELKNLYELKQKRENLIFESKEFLLTLNSLAKSIQQERQIILKNFKNSLDKYLSLLNLHKANYSLINTELNKYGFDILEIKINNSNIETLSYGEQNRLRLALLTFKAKFENDFAKVIFLDEIDANLSGEESIKVAKVLKELSKKYQVFAISHQPQLTSKADQHFLVFKKDDGFSYVKELSSQNDRISEIVRMVGGKISDKSVRHFAKKLLEEN